MTDHLLCLACSHNPPRELPDPIPEGSEVMFTEAIAGCALYCQDCFNQMEDE